jgi:hypothetical protein
VPGLNRRPFPFALALAAPLPLFRGLQLVLPLVHAHPGVLDCPKRGAVKSVPCPRMRFVSSRHPALRLCQLATQVDHQRCARRSVAVAAVVADVVAAAFGAAVTRFRAPPQVKVSNTFIQDAACASVGDASRLAASQQLAALVTALLQGQPRMDLGNPRAAAARRATWLSMSPRALLCTLAGGGCMAASAGEAAAQVGGMCQQLLRLIPQPRQARRHQQRGHLQRKRHRWLLATIS